ncbi:MAG TPA: queuosine precursor transporter [Patescibacteria group bacterium]|nr:queuosine precursor transporter [Patescibacteria group bacterium]
MSQRYKYYDFLMSAFVTVLICANMIGAAKIVTFWGFTFGAGILFFPLSYVFNDVLTEVYGYKRARRVIWAGFAALTFASLMALLIVALPPASDWNDQAAYETVFGGTWRIVLASLIAFWTGEFVNSFVLAKLKVKTEGKFLALRTIASTVFGDAVDSLIFYPIAFYGIFSNDLLITVMITNYILKVLWEVLATPITYKVVGFLKRHEQEDYYDVNTDFNPFSIKV